MIICPYCQQLFSDRSTSTWQDCKTCRVTYITNYHVSNLEKEVHIKWERDIGDCNIALNLYPQQNKTVLVAYTKEALDSDDPETHRGHTRIELNHCMTGITPENCLDKIKLLLMFQ